MIHFIINTLSIIVALFAWEYLKSIHITKRISIQYSKGRYFNIIYWYRITPTGSEGKRIISLESKKYKEEFKRKTSHL